MNNEEKEVVLKQIMSEADPMTDLEAEACLMENVRIGHMKIVGKNEAGETLFSLTEKGIASAEQMIKERLN